MTISSRSVFPDTIRPPKPNSVEPPWHGTRMPGGVGEVAPRGVPLSRSIPFDSVRPENAIMAKSRLRAYAADGMPARGAAMIRNVLGALWFITLLIVVYGMAIGDLRL
jgi:hypothetical protein